MKRLPVGRQNFKEIIQQDLLYIDKTKQIYDLISGAKLYFLSRPRRFGKTLLLSKFWYLFNGEKEVFKGLYIHDKTDYDFQAYPILTFNFASFGYKVENLEKLLSGEIEKYAKAFGVEAIGDSIGKRFFSLIESIVKKRKPVVLLIDEYDKPIIDFLTEHEKAKRSQQTLRDFFSPLKELDTKGYIRFLFITGVTKFSRVSLFSDLNNLTDLTLHSLSHDLLGITHEELLHYFPAHLEATAKKLNRSTEKLLESIKFWYNGYAFDPEIKLYNPFSILSFFLNQSFENYWFATGTPTFLANSIRGQVVNPKELERIKVLPSFFDKYSLKNIDAIGLLYQAGYVTIQEIEIKGDRKKYILGYPNEEVRLSMTYNLLEAYSYKKPSTISMTLINMEEGLEERDVGKFVEQLQILLADVSYHMLPRKRHIKQTEFEVWEGYFHTIIYLTTAYMGFHVQSEITKHKGRLDLLVETDDFLYLMEFKLDSPAEDAIQQIKDRKYAASYKNSPKTIYLVGVGFSKEERNVETWEAEIWER